MSGPIISPAWVANMPLQLEIKEKLFSWSDDTFDINDQNGRPVVKVKGKALSLHDKKQFLDLNGNPVLLLQAKLWSLHGNQEFRDVNGNLLFVVRRKAVLQWNNNVEIFMNDGDKDPDFLIHGDFWGKEYNIVTAKTGQEIAQIKRSAFGARTLLAGKDSYVVNVPPGTDILFALGVAVAVDELFHEPEDEQK